MNTPTPGLVFRFGACVLDVDRGQLRIDGQERLLKPLAMELLVYLIRHRHRPVGQDELMDAVWRLREGSPAAVATAIREVRRVIDTPGRDSGIKTMHRVGYQFVGDISVLAVEPTEPETLPIAVLPLEPFSGALVHDSQTYDWVATLCNALAAQSSLAPVPLHDLLAMLQQPLAPLNPVASARLLRAQDPRLALVVHVQLSSLAGGYRLAYLVSAPSAMAVAHIEAPDMPRLASGLARALFVQLGATASGFRRHVGQSGTWSDKLMARAAQAAAGGQLTHAALLLQVVLDTSPDDLAAQSLLANVRRRLPPATGPGAPPSTT